MKSFAFIVLMMTAFNCISQKVAPPAKVQSAFSKAFPGATVKNWDKEKGKYEAEFTQNNKRLTATFNVDGTLEETETDIPVNELPAGIVSYIQAHYKGAAIKEAAAIVKSNGIKMYEAEIKDKDILFDENGKFIQEEKDED